jgi:hypothetical protein
MPAQPRAIFRIDPLSNRLAMAPRPALLALLVLLAACARTADVPTVPVGRFYGAYVGHGLSGAPTDSQLAALTPHLSDTLRGLLAAARRAHDEEARTAPVEKPSFTDGDLFSSLFEGPTRYEVLVADTSGPPYRVPVRLTYDGATPAVSWTDTALVVRENDRLVVGDIVFGGAWEFGNRGSLRKGLEQALRPN